MSSLPGASTVTSQLHSRLQKAISQAVIPSYASSAENIRLEFDQVQSFRHQRKNARERSATSNRTWTTSYGSSTEDSDCISPNLLGSKSVVKKRYTYQKFIALNILVGCMPYFGIQFDEANVTK